MRAMQWLLCLLTIGVGGCRAGPADSFCLIAEPIRPSASDALSDGTVAQIAAHNAVGQKLCGWQG